MFTMEFPEYLWSEAVVMTSCLTNRMPTQIMKFETQLNSVRKFFPHSRNFTSLSLKVLCVPRIFSG